MRRAIAIITIIIITTTIIIITIISNRMMGVAEGACAVPPRREIVVAPFVQRLLSVRLAARSLSNPSQRATSQSLSHVGNSGGRA